MTRYKGLEVLDEHRSQVGESPLWDGASLCLRYLDIRGKELRKVAWGKGGSTGVGLPQCPGCIAPAADRGFVVGMEDGIYFLAEDGTIVPAHDKEKIAGTRFNDGKAGPDGSFYAGTLAREGGGRFYRLNADGRLETLFEGVRVSNGLDWSPDCGILYYCDTALRRIDAFDFDEDAGTLSNRRPAIAIPEGMGSPDGLCADSEGKLWIALWNGGAVIRADPTTGEILKRIEVPAAKPSCCAFAGPNLDMLVITSASVDADLELQPLAGYLFLLETEVSGRLPYIYGKRRST
ncbi:MAG: SMP-30/gluconolactonase/LRE family protein [Spirochaetes bacterium]|nr:SMP-30/gluconolactonase/LRE family protein [Spirochaetota bacterium]